MHFRFLSLALLAVFALLPGPNPAFAQQAPFKIGFILPMTGQQATTPVPNAGSTRMASAMIGRRHARSSLKPSATAARLVLTASLLTIKVGSSPDAVRSS